MHVPEDWNSLSRIVSARRRQLVLWLGPHTLTVVVVLGASAAGAILALIAHSIEPDDRIVVGNTAGSLTVVIESGQQRVVIGAGPSRSHAADLTGRITRPWERSIDLLILPGWDDLHVPGALGLIERRSVESIAIAGLPGDDPAWTLLERTATESDIPLRFISAPSSLELADDSHLFIAELTGDVEGIWTRFSNGSFHVDIFDSNQVENAQIDPRIAELIDDHITISMRMSAIPTDSKPSVAILPQPHWQHDFNEVDAHFVSGIDRNESLTISLDGGEVRIPQEQVEPGIN